ncbi:ankyrin repeat-containing domain protein [Aspergillus pseudoustus]|uniref:Ankyrin repeat-containing domain protein n=1 Tax=Aspergillus pseudoustus TaxID=1810923 RepID=A0ABR4K2W7_9EURO
MPPGFQPSLSKLPPELILEIASHLGIRDLNALVQTARQYDTLLSRDLYQVGAKRTRVNGKTPLIWAVRNHRLVATQSLLEQGADPAANVLGTTAIHEAIRSNNTQAVELILAQNISVFPHNGSGITPLILAASRGKRLAVHLLLEAGASVSCTDPTDWQIAIRLAVAEQNELGCRLLLEMAPQVLGSNVDWLQHDIKIQLMPDAARNGYTAILKVLWDFYVAPESERQATASYLLLPAAYGGCVNTTRWLFSVGAKLAGLGTTDKKTALHMAAEDNLCELVRVLLDFDADIEARDDDHHTPLHAAICCGAIDAVRLLLDRGANLLAPLPLGQSTLHLCVGCSNAELVPVLCHAGVDVHATDDDGNTALHYAVRRGDADVEKALLEVGATLNAPGIPGNTPT